MLDAMLARRRACAAAAVGNVGHAAASRPCCTRQPYDVLAVELSSFQLHWTALDAGRWPRPCLNVADDHLDWHGSMDGLRRATRAGSTRTPRSPASTTSPTRVTEQLVREADVVEGCRAVGFTLGVPGRSAWSASSTTCWSTGRSSQQRRDVGRRARHRSPTCAATRRPAPHNVANALAAAALARAYGVAAGRGPRRAARASGPTAHRHRATVADGRRRHATSTTPRRPTRTPPPRRCGAFDPVVWIAGGLAKGAARSTTSSSGAGRGCAAAVLIGRDRDVVARRLRDTRPMSRSSRSTSPRLGR